MNYKIYYAFFVALLFGACGEAPLNPEGNWVNIAQYNIIGQDTMWSKVPIVLGFSENGEVVISELGNSMGAELKQSKAKWEVTGNILKLVYAVNDEENLEIISHSKESFTTKQAGVGSGTYRVYKSLAKTKNVENISTDLQSNSYKLEAGTIESVGDKGLEIVFLGRNYVFPAYPESMQQPAIWTMTAIDEETSVLIMDKLTGNMLTWDIVEIKDFKDGNLEGEYFNKGKAQKLKLTTVKDVPTKEELDELAAKFVGKWEVKLNSGIANADTTNTEVITLNADKTCQIGWLGLEASGKWTIAKTGSTLFFNVGPTFNYFKIGEISDSEISGDRRCRAVPSGEEVKVRLVKVEGEF
ncbi:MAG: hypothetical protein GY810_07245 [Aureispira sp.]|nr:hypothetical protein [Aureispira sp.]